MTDPKLNDSKLDDLATRLSAAREKAQGKKAKPAAVHSAGMGAGMRIAIEMVVAVIIGFGIGYGIDWALGTKPWFMLLFFFLGVAAAFMNAVRTAKELDAANKAARAARNKGQDRAGAADTENATHRGWADEDEEEPWVYQTKKEE